MNHEKLFAEMAKLHAEKEGERLRRENEYYIENAPFPPSRDFEKRVYAKIRAERFRRPAYAIVSIAACIMILIVSLNVLPGLRGGGDPRGAQQAQGTQNTQNAQGTQPATRPPEESGMTSAAAPGQPGYPASAGSAGHELIKLAFKLPPNCSVADVEQDIGQTIYYIKDTQRDDIVLIAEKTVDTGGTGIYDEDRLKRRGLSKIEINDTALYAVAKTDYNYFTFQRDGIIYNLTCKYDYKTLISFCEFIL